MTVRADAPLCRLVLATFWVLMAAAPLSAQTKPASAGSHAVVTPAGPYENVIIGSGDNGKATGQGAPAGKAGGSTTLPASPNAAKTQPASSLGGWQVATALGVVLALIFVMQWVGRRVFTGSVTAKPSRAISVVSRSIISPRQQLMLVSVGRRLVLVSNTSAGMSSLCEIADPEEVAQIMGQLQREKGEGVARSFKSLFKRAGASFEPEPDDAAEAPDAIGRPADPPARVSARPPRKGDIVDVRSEEEPGTPQQTHEELSGLMQRVKAMSRSFQR